MSASFDTPPLRLAAIATSWRHGPRSEARSHADVILTRWLTPLPSDRAWGWNGPRSSLATVHIEQLYDDDEIHALCRQHNIILAPSIEEALTLDGRNLAVDAVLILAEHGNYPVNELGQKLYPRKEYFDRIVAVYEQCGRTAPIFCDKHFSWNFQWAQQMVATADRMGFMLFGGSSLPHCALSAPLPDLQRNRPRQVVGVFTGGMESYGFHSMELVQAYLESRTGGETGVRCVTNYQGSSLTDALERDEWSNELFKAAVDAAPSTSPPVRLCEATVVDYIDGVRAVHLLVDQAAFQGWAMAVQCEDDATAYAANSMLGGPETNHGHFARLARIIEDTLIDAHPPFPAERTLLTTGMIAAAMRARAQVGKPLQTPELAIRYIRNPARGQSPGVH